MLRRGGHAGKAREVPKALLHARTHVRVRLHRPHAAALFKKLLCEDTRPRADVRHRGLGREPRLRVQVFHERLRIIRPVLRVQAAQAAEFFFIHPNSPLSVIFTSAASQKSAPAGDSQRTRTLL